MSKQKMAEEAISAFDDKLKQYSATNAALLSLDPKTGQILAMMGSRDYFNNEIDGQFNVTTALRQPGSSIKPLVYAAAFNKGYTPDTILYDVITNFSNDPTKTYQPLDYDGQERGPVTMRQSLAGSLNIPAVKAIYLAGTDNVVNLAKDLGYSSLSDKNRLGLSLVLGGGEVKMTEHANAYSAFAREGRWSPIAFILKVEDKDGKILEEYKDKNKTVLNPTTARLINDILSDNDARSYVFGTKNHLTLPDRPVAAKTGTTNDFKDAWTIGYTPSLITSVWVGNNNGKSMKAGADGSKIAAPIWQHYMKNVLTGTPIETFKKPDSIVTGKSILDGQEKGESIVKIDKASGLLATDQTPPDFVIDTIYFNPHSILHFINKDDPRGDAPAKPEDDPQYALWEKAILGWANKQKEEREKNGEKSAITFGDPPKESDNLHGQDKQPFFILESPSENTTLAEPSLGAILSQATAPRGIQRAEYYIDERLLFINTNYPFNLDPQNIAFISNGIHVLTVKVCDDIDNCRNEKRTFSLNLMDDKKITLESKIIWASEFKKEIASSTFPLALKLNIENPNGLKNLSLSWSQKDSKTPQLFKQFSFFGPLVEVGWNWPQLSGDFELVAQGETWSGEIVKSKTLSVKIKQ